MTEIFLTLGYSALLLFLIGKMRLFTEAVYSVSLFRILFVIKLLAAGALVFIYTRFYPEREHADIFRYYDDSAVIYGTLLTHPWDYFRMLTGINSDAPELMHYYDTMHNWYNSHMIFNDSRTMIRLCAFFRLIAFGTYMPIAVCMSFLAFCGLTGMFRLFSSLLPGREFFVLIGIYLLPDILIWTSGVVKEAFLVFGCGLLIWNIYQYFVMQHRKRIRLLYMLLLTWCLLIIKAYVLFLILPALISWMISGSGERSFRHTMMICLLYIIFMLGVLPALYPHYNLPVMLAAKQKELYAVGILENAKSLISIPKLDGTLVTMFLNAPEAFINVFCRPALSEISNPLVLLAAFENVMLNVFFVCAMFSITKQTRISNKSFFFSACFLVITLFLIVGWVTPILGAVVRYKVPALPFLIFILVSLPGRKWIYTEPDFIRRFRNE